MPLFRMVDPTLNPQATNAPEQAGQAQEQTLQLLDGQGPGYVDTPPETIYDPDQYTDFTDDPLYIEGDVPPPLECETNWTNIGGGFLLGLAVGYAFFNDPASDKNRASRRKKRNKRVRKQVKKLRKLRNAR